ncbi:MAG: C2H2-type zinc finger protein [Nitrososphaera sp.]
MAESKTEGPTCPYCGSRFKDNEELSRHIDRIHQGSGLLEGDSTKW